LKNGVQKYREKFTTPSGNVIANFTMALAISSDEVSHKPKNEPTLAKENKL